MNMQVFFKTKLTKEDIIDFLKSERLGKFFKRIIYIACFAFLCWIDHLIGSATGYIQYGMKDYTGVVIGIIILISYHLRDFFKVPYLIWLVVFFVGRFYLLEWGQSNATNFMQLETWVWNAGLYGVILIRMFYLFIIEKRKPNVNWKRFVIGVLMLVGMAVIRTDCAWTMAVCISFLCFYLTDFQEKDLNNLFSGMLEGIILGFFIVQGMAWLHRPYDSVRYMGFYSHHNMNGLFYMVTYAATLGKWYQLRLRKQSVLLRVFMILLAGLILSTTLFTGSRTSLITATLLTFCFLCFQFLSRRKNRIVKFLADGMIIVVVTLFSIAPSFNLIRYVPALVNDPIHFDYDIWYTKVKKDSPVDSKSYIELDEAIEELSERYLWFIDELNLESLQKWIDILDWRELFFPTLFVQAAEESESITRELYIEPGTDSEHPLFERMDEKAPVTIRVSIYKYFLNKLTLVGKKGNAQGVWLDSGNFASHAHNVLLQIAYDFGLLIISIWLIVIGLIYYTVFHGLRKRSGAWYFRLFVMCSYVTLFLAFGMTECVWIYGQLCFAMFFIIQYMVYHKSMLDTAKTAEEGGNDREEMRAVNYV